MATLLPRRAVPDVTIEGDRIETVSATAEYGWIYSNGRGPVWENAQNTGFDGPYGLRRHPTDAVRVRRIRHIITERVEIIDGPDKGTRIDL